MTTKITPTNCSERGNGKYTFRVEGADVIERLRLALEKSTPVEVDVPAGWFRVVGASIHSETIAFFDVEAVEPPEDKTECQKFDEADLIRLCRANGLPVAAVGDDSSHRKDDR